MPDAASLPEDLLMQAAIERLADGDSDHEAPFDPVDGLNLVIGPGSVEPTAGLLAAARRHSPQTFFHATGLGQECRDPNVFLWRLLNHLRTRFRFSDPVPNDPTAMQETLPNWLARAAAGGGIAIVIEGAHELSSDGLVADMDWLPEWLPQRVAFVVSAPPGPAAEQFRDRSATVFGWPDESKAAAKQSHSLQSLVQSDAAGPFLQRLWVSRAGLDIETLETLVGPLPRDFDLQSPGLMLHEQHLALASRQARDAVARRWLADHGRRQAIHLQLAEHFGNRGDAESLRLACWHWSAAGRRDRLADTLTDPGFLEAALQPAQAFEALRHWGALGGSDRMQACLEAACRLPGQSSGAVLGAAHLFEIGSAKDAPATWLRRAVELADAQGDTETHVRALQKLALHEATPSDRARELLNRALAIVREQDGPTTAALHHHLACVAEAEDDHAEAARAYQRGIELVEAEYGPDSPRLIPWLNNLAASYKASGDLASADRLARRALRLARDTLGAGHPSTASCCDQLAGIAYLAGEYDQSEPLYREVLDIAEAAFGARHAATAAALGNLGTVLDARRKFEAAESYHRRSLGLLMALYGETHADTAVCMHNLAVTLESMGKLEEAEQFYRRALESWNEVVGEKSPAFATTLLHLAGVLRERGAWGESEALYRSDIELWRELVGPDHPHTLSALTELARLYIEGGKPEMAEPLLLHLKDRTGERDGKTGNPYLEVVALLARTYQELGEPAAARELIEDALSAGEGTLNMLSAPVQKLRKLLAAVEHAPTRSGSIDG